MPRTRVLLFGCLLFCFPLLFAACSEIPIVPISAPTPEPVQAAGPRDFDPKEMVLIPAGPFQMGCSPKDTVCSSDEKPLHTVTLSAYAIDIHEVTNARYAACVAAGGCTDPHSFTSVVHSDYYNDVIYANFPVIHVDWRQASAFCEWEGKRLPTEAEWEKAARGSDDTRIYPWGNEEPECTLLNAVVLSNFCVRATTKVGSYPAGASPRAVMDMSGNVWEWVNDWYSDSYYAVSPANDPNGPTPDRYRVLRGGAWNNGFRLVRVSDRNYSAIVSSNEVFGFRCALSQ